MLEAFSNTREFCNNFEKNMTNLRCLKAEIVILSDQLNVGGMEKKEVCVLGGYLKVCICV